MSLPFSLQFYGVRGSIACPGSDTLRYGGNTSCVAVHCGEHVLILDAGTGIKILGDELAKKAPRRLHLLFSHTHMDHVNGFPFFKPAYIPGFELHMWAGHLQPKSHLREQIDNLMASPLFPVGVEIMASNPVFHDFHGGETLDLGIPEITVRTCAIPHPNGATAYRIEYQGKSICYVTDTEHPEQGRNAEIVRLIEGTDLFIYDSNFTDEEYPAYKGWGHSTWQEGVRLAQAANVKTYVAFHHDPSHTDDRMDAISDAIEQALPGSVVAKEGMILLL